MILRISTSLDILYLVTLPHNGCNLKHNLQRYISAFHSTHTQIFSYHTQFSNTMATYTIDPEVETFTINPQDPKDPELQEEFEEEDLEQSSSNLTTPGQI